MRSGGAYHRVKFFAKQITRDSYGASSDTWDYDNPTIETRGEVRYTGGAKTLNNEEKFYSKYIELIVRYRSTIVETMQVQIDDTGDLWGISYIEVQGMKESLRLTLEKLSDGLSVVDIDPPTGFTVTLENFVDAVLAWSLNGDGDPVIIERSPDGNRFNEIARSADETYTDEDLEEETRYYYRVKSYKYKNYSAYTAVETILTEIEE
jgi:hypothetical protein